jgi:hypothetical protein
VILKVLPNARKMPHDINAGTSKFTLIPRSPGAESLIFSDIVLLFSSLLPRVSIKADVGEPDDPGRIRRNAGVLVTFVA